MSDGDPQPTVRMVDPHGAVHDIPSEQVGEATIQGFRPESSDETRTRLRREVVKERQDSVAGTIGAATFGALRGATLGGSDALVGALGGDDFLRETKEAHPGLSLGSEIIGAIATAGTSLPGGLAARAGARIAATEAGASVLTRVGRAFAGGAAEGGLQGIGEGVSELALSKDPVTLERAASVLSSRALFGAGVGGAAGSIAKTAEIGLGRARQAIDEHVATRAAVDSVDTDLAGLDLKGLKQAEGAELGAIEAARVPQRAQVAGDIGAHRQALKDEKIWLATNGATDRDLKEVGKIAFDADRTLDRLLNNPKVLAQKPQRAMDALQQQEHALEKLEGLGDRLRSSLEPDALDVNKLTAAERDAVDVYTGGEHSAINAHLRGKKHWGGDVGADHELTKGTVGEAVKGLDSLISRSTVAEPMTVFRGVPAKQYRVGQTITDKGFGSVSLNRGTADGFASGAGKPGRILEIEVPAGAKALNASQIMGGAEAEFILPRGAKLQITEVMDDVVRARLKTAKGSGTGDGSARIAALDKIPAALERNRALQQRIAELGATPSSGRLDAISTARDALQGAGRGEKTIAEQMLQGAVFSAAAGGVSALAGDSPLAGVAGLVAPFIGAKASKLVGEQVFGRLGKATSEAATRASKAASAFIGGAEKAVQKAGPLAVPIATKVLERVRYAPEQPEKPASANAPRRNDLPTLFAKRSEEIRSQTMFGPDGKAVMRPEARMAVGETLKPVAAVNPHLADVMETVAARGIELLANMLPRKPDILANALGGPDNWRPSDMEMRAWARLAAAVEDPVGVLERAQHGLVSVEDARVMREVYPEMLADFVQQVTEQLHTVKAPLPYAKRVSLSMLTGKPLDPAMDPRILGVLQQQFATEEPANETAPGPTAKPQFGSVEKQEPTPAQARTA